MSAEGNVGGAYGAGKAGAPFDPLAFIKKPQVILRLVSVLFSIVVFASISSGGYFMGPAGPFCIMAHNTAACGYGTAIGVIAFLASILFLIMDALFDQLSSVQHRRYVVIGDLVFSGAWSFLWFVGFCLMCDSWRKTDREALKKVNRDNKGVNDVQAAIAFAFFSIFTWAALAFFAFRKYRAGAQDAFTSGYEPDPHASSPYSSFPGSETGEPYQQPPFAPSTQKSEVPPSYNAPTY